MSLKVFCVALAATTALVSASANATMPESFADLVEQVSPAVVTVVGGRKAPAMERPETPFQVPPGDDGQPHRGTALGSGFIVAADGYVVTNNHVIDDADGIRVITQGGTEYPATLVGHDLTTDLALLKIESDDPLPTVAWGDSDQLRVGDWVVAVGNPFGLGGTVTAGILSARGRDLGNGPLDDFLQIDAPINQGNSGGPTFDGSGKVVGVNTAIYSPSSGSVGIGFAIPSELAEAMIADLRDDGAIERGWIGVQIQEVTPDLAAGLGLDSPKGALVSGIAPGGPAAAAGFAKGDVVLRFGDQDVATMRDLPRVVTGTAIDAKIPVVVWRGGKEMTLQVTVALRDEAALMAASERGMDAEPVAAEAPALGLALSPITEAVRQRFGIPVGIEGAVIVDVDADGPSADKGLRPGDVIVQIAADKVASLADVTTYVDAAAAERMQAVLLLINRGGDERFVAVTIGKA